MAPVNKVANPPPSPFTAVLFVNVLSVRVRFPTRFNTPTPPPSLVAELLVKLVFVILTGPELKKAPPPSGSAANAGLTAVLLLNVPFVIVATPDVELKSPPPSPLVVLLENVQF